MSKKMLMNATQHEENRVAIVEDGILTELDIEVAGHEPTKGNIYRAVVVRVESGLQAAFVDYGAGRLGFLQIDEINYKTVKPDYQPAEDGRRPRITDLLQRGQELLVQITKEERGTKGAALTTYLSLAGRYMVIMPGSKTRGVSRKAESDSQRKELKQAMSSIDMAENVGYIVRTAALNQTREELERDYNYLIRLYESIQELNQKVKAPALLYKESNLIIRSIRDYFTTDMDEVLIDDLQVFKEARDFFQMVMPDHAKLVKLHQERRPIFSRYQIEDQIETLSRNKVPLPSGGSIVIDPTEALVAIDVNSGKMASEQGVEATATKTNIEAAREVGRQLRLRDLGGLVVIDFIDMRERKHAREVEKELKKSLEHDKARVSVGRISQFGLLEMSRQRIKGALAEGTYLMCPHCQGTGHLKSPETQAAALLRKIHASAAKGQVSKIDAQLPLDVAAYLLNNKREDLVEMERDHNLQIHIHGNRDYLADQVELEITKREKDKPAQQEFVAAGLLPVPAETPEKKQNGDAAQKEDAEGNKKRRRRRRRKSSTDENTQPDSQEASNSVDEVTEEKTVQPSVEDETSDKQEKPAEETATKPQRRRRPPRKKQPTEPSEQVSQVDVSETAATAAETAKTEPTQEKSENDQPVEQQEPPAKKPQRRRRTQSKKKETEQPAATQDVTDDKKADVSQKDAEKAPSTEDKPKRRPSRRKPKAADTTEQAAASLEAKTEQPVDAKQGEAPEAQEPVKKPAQRRPRRAPKKAAQEGAVAPDKAIETETSSEVQAEKQEQKKPVRPRRRRPTNSASKPQEKSTETDQATAPGAATAVAEVKADKNTTDAAKTEGSESSRSVPSQGDMPEQKKPARRRPARRPSKKDETAQPETKDADKTAAPPAEEKPKPRRGRPRKKPVVTETTEKE